MTPDPPTGRDRTPGTVVVVGVLLALILGGAYWFIQGRDRLEATTTPAAGPDGSQARSTAGGDYRWTLPADWTVIREWAGPDTVISTA